MPCVSVIIPAYNSELYIRETIDSVLQQTFKDLEVIVVNDGSTDQTASIVKALTDDRIHLISKANGGTASARNLGIRNSTGKYIQLLDADDLILPDKLARQVELLDSNPCVDVVYSSFRYFYHDRCDLYAPDWLRPPSDDPYRELVRGSIFPPNAALFRREIAERVGMFNTNLISAEDWDFWIRVARSGATFLFHDELYALYRQHTSNKTKNLARWRHAHVRVMEDIRNCAENEMELQRISWHYYASHNYVLWALALMVEGQAEPARNAMRHAYSLDSHYGHSYDALAKRIAEYALIRDSRNSDQEPSGVYESSQWLDELEACFPESGYSKNVMRLARKRYWMAKAFQAHTLKENGQVRKFLWFAIKRGGLSEMNRGMLSIAVQSFIGQDNWSRLKKVINSII
ncbi:MAG: glycosyltransferase [candidate division KSB1 bacterium]|nr:glycosyltransferase [candidate division KSB1 bacterium]